MAEAEPLERLKAALADCYALEREIGAGGMATVYLAQDLKHHRKVAVKVLRPDLAASLGVDRFNREITIAGNLQHPHILPLYDSGEADGFLYYVMPYVEGPTLRHRLVREGELPVAEAVRILRDVTDAVAAAHTQGVVHRDLKPENIMLSGRHALVADFGVAKAVREATGRHALTTAGVALGTPTYMAPEQAAADPLTDHRADLYALGVMAYEMLTGDPPFVRATLQAVLAAHVTEAPVPVTKRRETVPPALAGLVMRCLEKRPADRPQRAEELLGVLESLSTPSGGMTPTETQPVRGVGEGGRKTRRRLAVVAIALGAVALGGFGLWRWMGTPGATQDADTRIVVAWFDNHTGDEALADVGSLAAEWIADGLSRQGVATVIPASVVRELMRGDLGQAADHSRQLAARSRATVLVTGRYDRRGDSLEYRAEVRELARNRVLGAIGPIRGSREETSALDLLSEQVFMVLDVKQRLDVQYEFSRPRSLQAYREFATGYSDYFVLGRYLESVPYFDRAIALDSLWLTPRTSLIAALGNAGYRRAADSVRALARFARERAPVADQLRFDWLTASHDGEHERMYRLGQRLLEVDSTFFLYYAALPAANTGRAREVVRYAARRDTTLWAWVEWRGWDGIHLGALHDLGRHEEELNVARQNVARRGLDPETAVWMLRPLAAMGRTAAVDSLWERVRDMPDAVRGYTAGDVPANAGWEFLAHGHDEGLVRRMFQESLDHYLSRPPAEQAGFAAAMAASYMMAGHLPEARALLDSLSAAAPDNVPRLGQLGVVAALQGDTAAAREVRERLAAAEGPYLRGANTLWQGRIAGVLGDCSRATTLLRTALSEGQAYNNLTHHWYAALGGARECANLRAVLAPRE
jgi:tRNA A-37 threonylcarbamoyl transferase component Bud32/tetratricopeptide (TPR) repeat protein